MLQGVSRPDSAEYRKTLNTFMPYIAFSLGFFFGFLAHMLTTWRMDHEVATRLLKTYELVVVD